MGVPEIIYSTIARHFIYPVSEAYLGTRMLKYLKQMEERFPTTRISKHKFIIPPGDRP
ncbi:hypothetical protein ACFLTZ_04590 [Chloroflexota bacterium]